LVVKIKILHAATDTEYKNQRQVVPVPEKLKLLIESSEEFYNFIKY